ncbi:MAG: hypothetical protein V1792_16315 [Pseudomonadota bacterium]
MAEAEAAADRDKNLSAAAEFRAELDHAMVSIAHAPKMWPSHIRGTRRFLLRRFPFAVIYREAADAIEVVAIAHVDDGGDIGSTVQFIDGGHRALHGLCGALLTAAPSS